MLKKILTVLIACGCLLGWGTNAFAYTAYFETVNLDDGFNQELKESFLVSLRTEGLSSGTAQAYIPIGHNYDLYNDGTHGDIAKKDDVFGYMYPTSALPAVGTVATFLVDGGFAGMDVFNGNDLDPANVTSNYDQLTWNSVTGASSYHVAVWNTDHSFLDGGGYVDFSERVADFDLDASTTSIADLGLSGVPTGTGYTYGIFAIGDGLWGKDGWPAAKGTLTVTPEPISSLLFLFGGIFLIFSINRRKKLALA